MAMVDAVHSAVMTRGDMEEVPYADSDYTTTHIQLSDVSASAKSKFLPAFIATLVAAVGPFNFGFSLGYSSPIELKIEKDTSNPHLSVAEFSWFAVSEFVTLYVYL